MPHRPPTASPLLAALAAAAGLCACAPRPETVVLPPGAPRSALLPVVARDAVTVPAGTVPDALAADLARARLVVLGEIHYVEEHQAFLVALLARLQAAGFRLVVEEAMHATAWTGEEYVLGRSAVLPPQLGRFDRALLDGLRALNQGLPEAERVHFAGFDMNHWAEAFPAGATAFQARFGPVAALADLLAAAPGSAAYQAALEALPGRLAADRAAIVAAVGPERAAQLSDLVEVERRSLPLRQALDAAAREVLIRERVARELAGAGTAGVVLNCGMTHAQRVTLMGPVREVVGTWLAAHPEAYGGDPGAMRVVAFAGARGSRLAAFDDPAPWSFDLVAEDPDDSLTRILAEHAGDRLAWLPLADPVFSSGPVRADYGRDLTALPLGRQFDGLVLYPRVSVLRSLAGP